MRLEAEHEQWEIEAEAEIAALRAKVERMEDVVCKARRIAEWSGDQPLIDALAVLDAGGGE